MIGWQLTSLPSPGSGISVSPTTAGNFFAHALVFDPNALAPHGYNPLALSHSDLFLSSDSSEGTTLPALADPATRRLAA